ncbi:MAG: alpha/beta fold hydrolase [Chromatiaceae bacterium]|jgi:esterase/lipase superfamily enzyme|nr:alpha/beta fold hydrolase [Chromatiaceae bacterium]
MMRKTKKLLWVLAAAFLVLAGLGAYGYFLGTTAALERAESFQFRRMQVAKVGDDGVYRFFFVTNRESGRVEGPLAERFTATRADRLELGSFDTEIEPSLGLGMWLDTSRWFLDEEIQIRNVHTLEPPDFVAQARAMVEASPHRALLLLVHGYRTDFNLALRATAFLAHILDINAPVMVFDWPGNQGDSLRGYRRAREVAKASAQDLADTVRLIVREVQPERLWLVANSLGGQVAVDAVSALAADQELLAKGPSVDELVLTAPDVDYGRFNREFKGDLAGVVRNTTVYVSSNDRALLVARIINRERRLGESTLSKADAELVDEVEGLLDLMEADDTRVSLVDATPVNRTRNFHNFSLEVPEYFDDVFLRLTNSETPQNRVRYRFRTPNGKIYFVLTRGR